MFLVVVADDNVAAIIGAASDVFCVFLVMMVILSLFSFGAVSEMYTVILLDVIH